MVKYLNDFVQYIWNPSFGFFQIYSHLLDLSGSSSFQIAFVCRPCHVSSRRITVGVCSKLFCNEFCKRDVCMHAARLISWCLFLVSCCESLQRRSSFIWEAETLRYRGFVEETVRERESERERDGGMEGRKEGGGGAEHTRGERRESNQPAVKDWEIRSVWTTETEGGRTRTKGGERESDCQKCYYSASSPLERGGYPSHFFGLSKPSFSSLYNVISSGLITITIISFYPFPFFYPPFFISLPRFLLSISVLLLLLDLFSH